MSYWAYLVMAVGYVVMIVSGTKLLGKYRDAVMRIAELEGTLRPPAGGSGAREPVQQAAQRVLRPTAFSDIHAAFVIVKGPPEIGQELLIGDEYAPVTAMDPATGRSWRLQRYEDTMRGYWVENESGIRGNNEAGVTAFMATSRTDMYAFCQATLVPQLTEHWRLVAHNDNVTDEDNERFLEFVDKHEPIRSTWVMMETPRAAARGRYRPPVIGDLRLSEGARYDGVVDRRLNLGD